MVKWQQTCWAVLCLCVIHVHVAGALGEDTTSPVKSYSADESIWLFGEFRGSARFAAGFDELEDRSTINPRLGDAEPGTVPIP